MTIILGIILLSSFIIAGDNDVPETATSPDLKTEEKKNYTTSDLLKELKDRAEEAKKNESLRLEKATDIFTTPLPSFLEKPTRVIFNVDSREELNLEKFIILLATIILIFLVLFDVLSITVFSEANSAFISFGMSIIIAITGIVPKIGFYILDLLGKINLTKTWIVILVSGVMVLYLIVRALIKVKMQNKITNAYKRGARLRMGMEKGRIFGETVGGAIEKIGQ